MQYDPMLYFLYIAYGNVRRLKQMVQSLVHREGKKTNINVTATTHGN